MHFFFAIGVRHKLGRLHKHQVKLTCYAFGTLHVYQTAVATTFLDVRFENVIDRIQRTHRLQQVVLPAGVHLTHVRLGNIEHYTLLKFGRPYHLYFHDERVPFTIPTVSARDTIFRQGIL